jgi:sterol desaturase/sphingolipid hydroxylase (fatty acid hydroxylase superfamily)
MGSSISEQQYSPGQIFTMSPEHRYNRRIENRAVFKLVLFVLVTVLVSIIALTVNIGMMYALAEATFPDKSEIPFAPKLKQLTILLGPVLLFLEWYVWDVFTAGRTRRRN